MAKKIIYNEKQDQRIRRVVEAYEREGGSTVGPPGRKPLPPRGSPIKSARISVESGAFSSGRPYTTTYPAELGKFVAGAWEGNETWIVVANPNGSFFFENDVVTVRRDGQEWITTDGGHRIVFASASEEIEPSASGNFTVSGETLSASNPTGVYVMASDPCMLVYRGSNAWYCLPLSC